jgi:hypothetical protein
MDSNWWKKVADERDRALRGPEKLQIGRKYDTTKLMLSGWTERDGTQIIIPAPNQDFNVVNLGHRVEDYFTPDGVYLGPDQHGIEPLFLL